MKQGFLTFKRIPMKELQITSFILAIITGISILTLPYYVPIVLLIFIIFVFSIVEKPETGIIPLALCGLLMSTLIGYGSHPPEVSYYARYNFRIVDKFVFEILLLFMQLFFISSFYFFPFYLSRTSFLV